ncbi:response regulator receiver protein [Methylocucumis oryzae]|uniref:Response regulator receiver protein n=2 Tax=Methylocucumis oryzae TaxID=1632867 RepID=A0A0F3IMX7_9GAMM|nr:response regulator receiver protein [Methylocucumis oryzae]
MDMDNNKKLLIVDDSKVSRMLIRAQVAAQRPEWAITEANSGEQALDIIDENLPDYCMMDINMSGILGTDAAEIILSKYPTVRIVILSANIQETYQNRASGLGISFVAKPVSEKSISQAISYFEGA